MNPIQIILSPTHKTLGGLGGFSIFGLILTPLLISFETSMILKQFCISKSFSCIILSFMPYVCSIENLDGLFGDLRVDKHRVMSRLSFGSWHSTLRVVEERRIILHNRSNSTKGVFYSGFRVFFTNPPNESSKDLQVVLLTRQGNPKACFHQASDSTPTTRLTSLH